MANQRAGNTLTRMITLYTLKMTCIVHLVCFLYWLVLMVLLVLPPTQVTCWYETNVTSQGMFWSIHQVIQLLFHSDSRCYSTFYHFEWTERLLYNHYMMVTQYRICVTSQKYQICGFRFNQTTDSQTKNITWNIHSRLPLLHWTSHNRFPTGKLAASMMFWQSKVVIRQLLSKHLKRLKK